MVHGNMKTHAETTCPETEQEMLPLEHPKKPHSESSTQANHVHDTTDPLDGYPLGVDSYREDNIVTTKFYKDLRYMTLDHESDYLWEEHLHMVTGNIKLPPTEDKGNSSLKAIAM
jgi:hypothetical protein